MQYEHVIEERVYKYGPGQALKNYHEAKEHIYLERCRVLTKLSLAGLYKTVEEFTTIIEQDRIVLRLVIRYPKDIL